MRIKLPKTWHRESLLNIPLVQHLFRDPGLSFQPRRVDCEWSYDHVFDIKVTGYNPFRSEIYYGSKSRLSAWLQDPAASARRYNVNDSLIFELLLAVHDYLHSWTVHIIQEIYPKLEFGTAPITKKNIEDFVFCLLVSEAVATVGLDFWYLSETDLNQVCCIGTVLSGLSSSYKESYLSECQKFNPDFEVQKESFFFELATVYCSGDWPGFDLNHLERSPQLLGWIRHEMMYGELQRIYAREWFSFMAVDGTKYSPKELKSPVPCKQKWQKNLIREVGRLLWRKVKEDILEPATNSNAKSTWASDPKRPADFRFVNVNRASLPLEDEPSFWDETNFKFFFHQFVGRYDYQKCDKELIKLFKPILQSRDRKLLEYLFRDQVLLKPVPGESRDVFFPN